MSGPQSWDCDEVVRRFDTHEGLRTYAREVRGMKITGSDLQELTDPKNVEDMLRIGSFVAKKVASLIAEMIGKQDLANKAQKSQVKETENRYSYPHGQPTSFVCFCFHSVMTSRTISRTLRKAFPRASGEIIPLHSVLVIPQNPLCSGSYAYFASHKKQHTRCVCAKSKRQH